ncbi:hypothetical protein OSTOST_00688 [Ostertagia ostertagi]
MAMVESILRSLRSRRRRPSSVVVKQVKEANSVNVAIENELALLNKLHDRSNSPLITMSRLVPNDRSKSPRKSKDDSKSSRKPLRDVNQQQPMEKKASKKNKGEDVLVLRLKHIVVCLGRNLLNKKEGGPPSTIKESSESSQTLDDNESDKGGGQLKHENTVVRADGTAAKSVPSYRYQGYLITQFA